jgi:VWFA-related protein
MRALQTLLLSGALLIAALPADSQTPGQAPAAKDAETAPGLFGEQIDVRVVNVEIVVTDKQGNRVAGLGPADFRLRVDGKEVPVEYFSEVRGGQAIAPDTASGQAPVPGLPALAPGNPVGTSYLVFIDDFFAVTPRRNEVLRSLKDQLTLLGPDDRMAIVAYDGREVTMLSSWSNSERALGRSLEQAIGRPSYGFQRLAELRNFETSQRVSVSVGSVANVRSAFARQLDLEEIGYAQHLGEQESRVVAAAVSTLRGFASPPGRKVMLLLSGGWPYSPADFAVNNPNRPVLNRDVPNGEDILRPLTDTANRLGYTIYPVDVPGLETNGPDASLAGPSDGGLNIREQEVHGALEFIASQTGGRALLNSLRVESLPGAAEDTRSYYWLGFTPTWQKNDKRHKVQVDVTRPGLKVRSREDFLDLSRKSEVSMMVESAMLFGNAPGASPMPMQVGKPVKSGRREIEVPITLAIPGDLITVVPLNGKQVAELELRAAAVDVNGDRSSIPVVPLKLSADAAPPKGAFFKYETRIKLRNLKQHLIVAVFDPLSNHILTAEAEVAPPL